MSSQPSKKITIHEVAARAGVSLMTVSRVLRNEPYVAQATRAAVQQAIAALNYVPLQSARNLSSSVAKVLGLVVPHTAVDVPHKTGYEYLSALYLGAMQICNRHGYGLMLVHAESGAAAQDLVRRAGARQVGGYVLAAPVSEHAGLLATLRERDIAHASISPLEAEPGGLWAAADERVAAREMALHIAAQGLHAIAYVGSGRAIRAGRERLAGHKEALKQLGLRSRREWTVSAGLSFEAGLAAGRKLLALQWIPDAVQCETDELAAGVIAAAHELGMRLPNDLSVVGFDDFGLAHKVWPALTTAQLPVEEMAAHAASQVIGALEGRRVENRLFTCAVQFRQSVAMMPAAGRPDAD
ncbi:MAG: LacI family DNA-binding transcriptional regulator [Burkholderiales bacterium]|nr:LacI family transcriptional regulator [Burkholderiales bacterium]MDE1926226.1 LacI family DNA-binding transcriptional regulator [Burkholderiales bacterium]MDE2159905.1 LacI family DNA-binding transcriptional regulator [Burkholderiales bacterium]MDE2501606.1 LacI family DNA-binding transcriptional regulator [Burkholderiales bacterium]